MERSNNEEGFGRNPQQALSLQDAGDRRGDSRKQWSQRWEGCVESRAYEGV